MFSLFALCEQWFLQSDTKQLGLRIDLCFRSSHSCKILVLKGSLSHVLLLRLWASRSHGGSRARVRGTCFVSGDGTPWKCQWLRPDNSTRASSFDRVPLRTYSKLVHRCFVIGIFCFLRHMHFNPILAHQVITRLAEVDWDATGVEWFSFEYEQPKSFSIHRSSGSRRKSAHEQKLQMLPSMRADQAVQKSLLIAVCLSVLLIELGSGSYRKATTISCTRR